MKGNTTTNTNFRRIFMKKWLITLCIMSFIAFPAISVTKEIGETIGYVVDINGDLIHIVGEPLEDDGFIGALVRLGNAPVYDLRTGFRVFPETIKKDMDIRLAYHIPPGANAGHSEPFAAVVAWLNWNEDDAAVFTVEVSENINNGEEGLAFLSSDGKYRVVITPETIITDPQNKNLTPADIHPGMEFFVWVDILTASSPALIYPHKVVVVR
jgi:hypothetical protein